jgi:hypothetical protein
MGTMPNLTKCFYLGSQWTALKPTVVSTRNRGKREVYDRLVTGTQMDFW